MIRRVMLCVVVVSLVSLGACQKRDQLETRGTRLPLVQFDEGILLEARASDRERLVFLLDTGSSISVISPGVAARLGLAPEPDRRLIVTADGSELRTEQAVTLRHVAFGEFTVDVLRALVLDVSQLGADIDGLIAVEALGDRVTIDYEHAEVSVGGSVPEGAASVSYVPAAVPTVQAWVAGRTVDVILDTAGSGAWSLPSEGLVLRPGPSVRRGVVQIDGARLRSSELLEGLAQIGPVRFSDPVVHVTRGLARVGERVLRELGVLTFDAAHQCVWIHDANEREVHMGALRGIGARMHSNGDVWVVRSVEPGLPAAQVGILSGERVRTINGLRPSEISTGALRRRISESAVLKLEVERAGRVELVFTPVVYIQP